MKKSRSVSKSAKGFYTALGISALMVGSACYFAYNQGNKNLKLESDFSASESIVDNKKDDIPKQTNPPVTTAPRVVQTTVAAKTDIPTVITVPAEDAAVIVQPRQPEPVYNAKSPEYKAPLVDMSNIINPFSGKELVKNATTGSWQTHNGTDIAANIGDDVRAICEGEVTAINNDPLWGTTVIVNHHDGYISKYCGLSKDLPVQLGQIVIAGDVIGALGDTCDIESGLDSHLHIEVTKNGEYIDPVELLN